MTNDTKALIEKLANNIVFIAGSGKNSGKTTFMNYALGLVRKKFQVAYLSIGVDGEKKDAVFGNLKPKIYAEVDDFLVTTKSAIQESNGMFEIHEVFCGATVLGENLLVKVVRSGYVELIGPEDNAKLAEIIQYLVVCKGIKTIFIDGAVNRITQIATVNNGLFVYVMKITPLDIARSIKFIKMLSLIETFGVTNQESNNNSLHYLEGALTQSRLREIPDYCGGIVLEDFTKIFLSYEELVGLLFKNKIFLKNTFSLAYVCVNNYDITEKEFLDFVSQERISSKIVFNPYKILA